MVTSLVYHPQGRGFDPWSVEVFREFNLSLQKKYGRSRTINGLWNREFHGKSLVVHENHFSVRIAKRLKYPCCSLAGVRMSIKDESAR